jgi:hypothetical protein
LVTDLLIKLPDVDSSKFNVLTDKAIEVTISDQSILLPGGGKQQLGFRRAGLLIGHGSDKNQRIRDKRLVQTKIEINFELRWK